MTLEIEVRSSGPGPRRTQGYGPYPETHRPMNSGRVVAYWGKCVAVAWPRDGVAIIIKRKP